MDARASQPDAMLSPGDVARRFRVSGGTVRSWVNKGKLTPVRTPGGARRYREAEVRALMEASRVPRVA